MDQTNIKEAVLKIDGDVDRDIETEGDVQVSGSVREGVAVRSGGDVHVAGEVGGDVTALGSVKVAGLLSDASVRSGARLVVDGLVGGEVYGVDGVEVQGAVAVFEGVGAVVGIVSDLGLSARLEKVREGVDFCEHDVGRILRTLGLKTVNKEQIQAVFQNTPPHKRKFVIAILKQLNQLVQVRGELYQKQENYRAQQTEKLMAAEIRFLKNVCDGTRICFGDEDVTVDRDLDAVTFYLREDEIKYKSE